MIPMSELLTEAAGVVAAGVAGGFVLQGLPPEAQEWTTLALMAAIGGWLVRTVEKIGDRATKSIDSNTDAQNRVATAMALMTQQTEQAQHATEQKRIEIVARLEKLSEQVQALKTS